MVIDNNLENRLEAILKDLKDCPPSLISVASDSGMGWMDIQLGAMYSRFLQRFTRLDGTLSEMLSSLRAKIWKGVTSTETSGLQALLTSPDEDWEQLRTVLIERAGERASADWCAAIDMLTSLSIPCRAVFLPALRDIMEKYFSQKKVSPDDEDDDYLRSQYIYIQGDDIETCKRKLKNRWDRAVGETGNLFRGDTSNSPLSSPAKILEAAVAEFRYNWMFGHDGQDKTKQRWNDLYRNAREEIWPAEFIGTDTDFAIAQQWNQCINALKNSL